MEVMEGGAVGGEEGMWRWWKKVRSQGLDGLEEAPCPGCR